MLCNLTLRLLKAATLYCTSTRNQVNVETHGRNVTIDKQLELDRQREERVTKLLLLGGPESGKSTFAKQIKILHMNGFNEADILNYRFLIQENSLECMTCILLAMSTMDISFTATENENLAKYFLTIRKQQGQDSTEITHSSTGELMQKLWQDETVQQTFAKRYNYYLMDSAKYFLDNIVRIMDEFYKPTIQDILMSRAATAGIYELEFMYNNRTFRLIDVGGQRSERRKWIHCFDNVTAVLFMVDTSGYCQKWSLESHETNTLLDSRSIFTSVINSRYFEHTAIILFLNKMDLLKEKLHLYPLEECFPDYTGSNECNEAAAYIFTQFKQAAVQEDHITCHRTVATDTTCMQFIFKECVHKILRANLKTTGFF